MDDPLSRALTEPQVGQQPDPVVACRKTHQLAEVLPELRRQLLEALTLPFFDAGVHDEPVPVLKNSVLENGSIRVSARRIKPAYNAVVTIDVRHVVDTSATPGHYEIQTKGCVHHDREHGPVEQECPVPVSVREDGSLHLDTSRLTDVMAEIIARWNSEDVRA